MIKIVLIKSHKRYCKNKDKCTLKTLIMRHQKKNNEASKEEPIIVVLHIDFIFGDQIWIVKDCDLLVPRQQLMCLMVRSHI